MNVTSLETPVTRRSQATAWVYRALQALPEGRLLPPALWRRRHRGILVLLWVQAAALVGFALVMGNGLVHSLLEGGVVALMALCATPKQLGRTIRALVASMGLVTCAGVLTHLSGGYIEMHFHFFVMLGVIALYQSWIPFLGAITYVAIHHGTMGVLYPQSVYNHPDAIANPWTWALIHASFVLAASVAMVVTWRAHETAQAYTELILDSAADGICGVDSTGVITFMNPSGARTLGWTRGELVGRSFETMLQSPDGSVSRFEGSAVHGACTDGQARDLKGQAFRRKDGSWVPVDYVVTPFRQRDQITGAVITFQDISDRLQADEAHSQLEAQLLQSQKMEAVGRLAGGVAHDFNNLLTVISGRAHMVLKNLGGEHPRFNDVELIQKSATRAAALTRQLLAFSRKQVLQPKVLSLNDIVEDIETIIRRLIREDVELATALAPDLGQVMVDPHQMEQVLMNLVVNGVDAMPTGGRLIIETGNVELSAAYAARHVGFQAGSFVMLAVSDNGQGMDADTRTRIFEPFFTTKETGKGTGLGLATVHGVVNQSGGHILVYSEPGHGTTFKIYLPRVDAPKPARRAVALADVRRGAETLLLVEDEEDVRELARDVLLESGYTVLEAATSEEAVRICEEHEAPISLLLSDVVMPKVSGPQLAKRLLELRPELEVLYMSGYTDEAIVHHGVLEPGTAFIEKPFTPEGLSGKVRDMLDAAAARR
ncbi:MAG TPA: ATP-binding protein [Longimicrobiales bacterium]|nr:ATP-binding protein [Longimicrobiales bacterium]